MTETSMCDSTCWSGLKKNTLESAQAVFGGKIVLLPVENGCYCRTIGGGRSHLDSV